MRSFSRWMLNRASGTAMVESTTTMDVAIINSRSVKPHSGFASCPRLNLCTFISKF